MLKQMLMVSILVVFMAMCVGCQTASQVNQVTEQELAEETTPFEMPVRTEPTRPRELWANSYLFTVSPKLEFEKWLTEKPEMDDKFVILEFWRTWCSACKKGTPFLNEIQKRYSDDVVVIGVNAQSEEMIKTYQGPKKNYYLARDKPRTITEEMVKEVEEFGPGLVACAGEECGAPDTIARSQAEQGELEAAYGVWGWPHVVILEPTEHAVVWEGFPGQPGYELTEDIIKKCIAVHKSTSN